jgi:hypothetical protein
MLSSVLNSKREVQVNLQIIRAFIALRETLAQDRGSSIPTEPRPAEALPRNWS